MSTVYLHEMRAAMYAKPGLVPIRLIGQRWERLDSLRSSATRFRKTISQIP
jgi:hypothetical protein